MTLSVKQVFQASDAKATTFLYEELEARGPLGVIAVNILRASKKAARAEVYKGGDKKGAFKKQAVDQKAWAVQNLCRTLDVHARSYDIRWGWQQEQTLIEGSGRPSWGLYIDLPVMSAGGRRDIKQVSFPGWKTHTTQLYDGDVESSHELSEENAISFAEYVRSGRAHRELAVA